MYRLSFSGGMTASFAESLMAGKHCGAPLGQGGSGLQVDRIHSDGRASFEAVGFVLELQHPAGADVGAHAAADAGGAFHVEVGHGVLADVDAHFAIGTERRVRRSGADALIAIPTLQAACYPAAAISFGLLARRRLASADRTSATR